MHELLCRINSGRGKKFLAALLVEVVPAYYDLTRNHLAHKLTVFGSYLLSFEAAEVINLNSNKVLDAYDSCRRNSKP